MRIRTIVFGILVGAVGICTPAKADVQCHALVSGQTHSSLYVSAVIAFSESRAEEWSRIEYDVRVAFHAYVRELTGARPMGAIVGGRRFLTYTDCQLRRDGGGEWITASGNEELVRTGWTGGFGSARVEPASPASATTRRNVSPSGAGRESRVYIMPPTAPGAEPPIDSGYDSEASRAAVAARYRQQQEQVRSVNETNARQAAEHQARLAQSERQQAAHRAMMADNARQQEAYRRARADWEARSAACRAGNRDACGARVTPQ